MLLNATVSVVNEVTFQGSRCGDLDRAMKAIADGTVVVDDLVSASFPLHATEAAIKATETGAKVVLEVAVRQSAFGITPFAAFGGGMRVQDAVRVSLALPASAFDSVGERPSVGARHAS